MRTKSSFAPWTLSLMLALCAIMAPGISQAQTSDPIRVQFTADKSDYVRGEHALMTLQVTNTSAVPVVLNFSNGQQYEFQAFDANGATLWAWSHGKSFSPSGSQRVLNPGQTWTIQDTWTFVGNDGQGAADGSYTLRGTLLANYLGKSGPKYGEQTVTISTPDSLYVALSTNKSSYGPLETATLTLTVTNVVQSPVTVSFNSAQLYDFTVTNSSGTTVWTWSNGKTFDPTPQQVVLQPGESIVFQESWGLKQHNGMPVGAGTYTVRGTFLGSYAGQSGVKFDEAQITVRVF
jgi:Flp pilus assembly protein TadG